MITKLNKTKTVIISLYSRKFDTWKYEHTHTHTHTQNAMQSVVTH